MEKDKNSYQTIDEYIALFPEDIQQKLRLLRETIHETVPEAAEKISWQMPTFFLHGNLVHFAAHKSHIGFYPGANGIEAFKERFQSYKSSKGAVQFPLNQPLPLELIKEIVRFRAAENQKLAETKQKR